MSKTDIQLISTHELAIQRCHDVCRQYGYSISQIKSCHAMTQITEVIILTTENYRNPNELINDIKNLKTSSPEAFLLVTISPRLNSEISLNLKKAGADCVFLDSDLLTSSKLEFVVFQKLQASHIGIKVDELKEGTSIDCFIYHLMPINKKFLPVIWPNETITEYRMSKIKKLREIFISRKDLKVFQEYKEKVNSSPIQNCRAQFQLLMASYFDLMLYFADHSESTAFKKGDDLLKNCIGGASNLVESLKHVNDVWPVFNLSPVGYYGSVERCPTVAAYAALLSIKSKIGNPADTIVAALLADLGMLFLSPNLSKKIRDGLDEGFLNSAESEEYKKHPTMSIVAALSRKIEIPEPIKNIILQTHARVDQKGFPYTPQPESIPLESMLIQFSELVVGDRFSAREKNQETMFESVEIFSQHFLATISKSMVF